MKRLLHLVTKSIVAGAILLALFGMWPHDIVTVASACPTAPLTMRPLVDRLPLAGSTGPFTTARMSFNIAFDVTARMPEGSLGLPGESILWVISLVNASDKTVADVIITDTLRDELLIETVDVSRGEVAISEQMIVYTLPELAPDESVMITITTTVLTGPLDGLLQNQAALVLSGPYGAVSQTAETKIFVPNGLPATGYAPVADAPQDQTLPLPVMVLIAGGMVGGTAFYVYRRGRHVLRHS